MNWLVLSYRTPALTVTAACRTRKSRAMFEANRLSQRGEGKMGNVDERHRVYGCFHSMLA